ncbi:MAG: alkaline phosphatase family protein [Saprospiraceae bacterium]|nr:alkaline phosphatase family protein [Saprospiraceae bacterium]
MRKIYLFILLMLHFEAFSQTVKAPEMPAQPKLVVGIVVDQMRYDYLYRYAAKYGNGGIKRLINGGFNCKNNHYHYASTLTGPGHAAVYTGSVPALNGIIGNEWFNPLNDSQMYVVADSTVSGVGTDGGEAGKMSPKNLKTTTITDQLRLSNDFKSRVFGVAIKDRGAILPAGHTANAAYWFDTKTGNWISSTYYMKDLPEWVKSFNGQRIADKIRAQKWETLLPLSQYTESESDKQPYENNLAEETESVFPHTINNSASIPMSPYANTMTKDFALSILKNEKLGVGDVTDFLCISFSTPDYIGHSFGTHSVEIEDCYLRLDRDLEDLLKNLDTQIGRNNYVVFLTADHGVADIPGFLKKNKIPAGTATSGNDIKFLNTQLENTFGEGKWIKSFSNYQIYLDHDLMRQKKVSYAQIYDIVKDNLLTIGSPVHNVINLHDLSNAVIPDYFRSYINNIYNPKLSGDFFVMLEPAWFYGGSKGTTHGSPYAYDTHVPLLFYGWKIPKGTTVERTHISDIAPTLAALLNILEPNGNVGKPIQAVCR